MSVPSGPRRTPRPRGDAERAQRAHLRDRPPLRLWAVHVVEKNPPPAATAIKWLLFTTVQVASAKQVLNCVRWYVRRWRIEEWQRVMKSGCKILKH